METPKTAELSIINNPKHQSTPKDLTYCHERRSLQTLQASPNGNGLNGGKTVYSSTLSHDLKNMKTPGIDQRTAVKANPRDPDHGKTPGCSSHVARAAPAKHTAEHRKSNSLLVYQDPGPNCFHSTQTGQAAGSPTPRLENVQGTRGDDSAFFDQKALDLMCGDVVPEDYWKDLAEERRRALEEALAENCELSQEVARLKKENLRLLNIAEEAKDLKLLLEGALADDEDSAIYTGDQSGVASETEPDPEGT